METPGLNGTFYTILSAALYLLVIIVLFFTVKSKLREIFLTKCREFFSKLDSSGGLTVMLKRADTAILQPLKNGLAAVVRTISKLSNALAGKQKKLNVFNFAEVFDIFALLIRKLYSPEPFVVLSYSAILFVVFYFILTVF